MFEFDDETIFKLKWFGFGAIAGYVLKGLFRTSKTQKGEKNTIYLVDRQSSGALDFFTEEEDIYEKVYRELNEIPENETVNIIIKTYGGSLTWCLKICETIRNRTGTTRVYVKEYAYSAGTIIALAADELYMCKNSSLSAIDPQYNILSFTQVALKTIPQLLRTTDESKTHMKESFEKELAHYKKQIAKYINKFYNVENVIDKMLIDSVAHEQIFFIDELLEIGISVKNWDGKTKSIININEDTKII